MLVVGAGSLQLPVMAAAKKRGYRVIAIDANAQAPGKDICDEFLNLQFTDTDLLIQTLHKKNIVPTIALTVGTDFSWVVAKITQHFDLKGPTPQATDCLTHKGKMRDFFARHKIPQPAYTYSQKKEEIEKWAALNPSPHGFVVKPAQNMGARGVMAIPDARHLCYAFEFAAVMDKQGEVIIEHRIAADEYSSDSLVDNGKHILTGLAKRHITLMENRFFIETGHTMPAYDAPLLEKSVCSLLQNVVHALEKETGQKYHGALKGDLRRNKEGLWFVGEIAARLSGGFMSTHTYPAATGFDLMEGYIKLLEKKLPIDFASPTYKQRCIERAVIAPAGWLMDFTWKSQKSIFETIDTPARLIHKQQNIPVGKPVFPLQNNIGKLANIILSFSLSIEESKIKTLELHETGNALVHYSIKEILKEQKTIERISRKKWNHKYCWVCKVCDGINCASSVPGMGGRGSGTSFQDNIKALALYKIVPRYIRNHNLKDFEADIRWKFLGLEFKAPIMTAPITGSITNMGGSITEWDYARESSKGAAYCGLLPTFGDGATEDKYRTGLFALQEVSGGIPFFKPRANQKEIIKRMEEAEKAGAYAWGMDIDGISFKTMVDAKKATSPKSIYDIKLLASKSRLPFIIKGVLSIEDALLAAQAGASAIVVSNHGGRVLEGAPGSARVLPEIVKALQDKFPQVKILVDGGIRSGSDIFKMLALGAHGVLIGRPVAIAAVGTGRIGVRSLFHLYIEELQQTMRVLGMRNLSEVNEKGYKYLQKIE